MRTLGLSLGLLCCGAAAWAATEGPPADGRHLAERFSAMVDRRWDLPDPERDAYAARLTAVLQDAGEPAVNQYILLIDRNPNVQGGLLFWRGPGGENHLIGATPVSTGLPGSFDHFETPLGLFAHSLDHLDYRATGTRNSHGVRGYGIKGMRVYDFGWQPARKGWGDLAMARIRFQMHGTDPRGLEDRLGTRQSKGCIRLTGTFNQFLDHYGILDADYNRAVADGRSFWVLPRDRETTPWAGRWLVIVDSERPERPAWAVINARR